MDTIYSLKQRFDDDSEDDDSDDSDDEVDDEINNENTGKGANS